MKLTFLIWPLSWYVLSGTTYGFLFEPTCIVPPGCTCTLPTINCAEKGLPRIPQFNMTSYNMMLYLKLQHNRIIVVPPESLKGIHTGKLYLDMSFNNIRDIHPIAFAGLEDNITILNLEHNLLTTIPVAVANLSSLTMLNIHDNAIATFDAGVMRSLGTHIEVLYFGSHQMRQWPSQLQYLANLTALHVYDLGLTHLPQHAFKGFQHTLINLEIDSTNLTSVPQAVCDLLSLRIFYFNNNTNLHQRHMLPSCSRDLDHVTDVSFDNNDLTEFPRVLDLFPNVNSLSVSGNPNLTTMDIVTDNTGRLRILKLFDNGFAHVPLELGNFTLLVDIDLHGNNLTELSDGDFDQLVHINRLDLSDNPISKVEPNAFRDMISLYYIGLSKTALPNLPVALLDLHSLHSVDFLNNAVVCNCDTLSWLQNMTNINSLRVTGVCHEPFGLTVSQFMQYNLDNC
ncbi:hypothetical protein DPMN_078138 [Dreissena polymorpha]|uniref:Uncharacterized protein n=2 Tax=Dreissena polymorpha TaxID=45954 RepID=A0A9D3YLP1_DREPO|nr:hypothetical protein DPMN_078138 [Dreissena polymorpha]